MKFLDKNNGHVKALEQIPGTGYWASKGGDLYDVEVFSGTCLPANPRKALESVLLHKDMNIDRWSEEQHLDAINRILERNKVVDETLEKKDYIATLNHRDV